MELVYLWVKEYKNINNQGFNFSNRFDCIYDDSTSAFSITKQENFLENFFSADINITAIVGENGVGKSSILEILTNKYGFLNTKDIFFVHFDSNTNELKFSGAKVNQLTSISIDEISYKRILSLYLTEDIQPLKDTKTVYFSNILNENDLSLPEFFVDRSYTHTVNISTSQVLNQMKLIETNTQWEFGKSQTGFDKIYRSYRIQQIQNAIILIKDNVVEIPFKLPEKIIIRNIDFHSFIKNAEKKFKNNDYQKILNIIRKNNDNQTIFKNYLSTNLVISLLLENTNSNNPILEELLKIIRNEKMTSHLENFYHNVRGALYDKEFGNGNDTFGVEYINDFFDLADNLLTTVQGLETSRHDKYYLELNINDTNLDFLKSYEKLIQQSEYFWDIDWSGISSGEENYLYQFSRLYQLKNGFKESAFMNLEVDNKVVNNIILLIDEGEVTLHPRWQKNYISYLVDFLQNNFTQKIHLILTTHSPFILSDIPNDNIIFLTKYKEGDPEIKNNKQKVGNTKVKLEGIDTKTFGANIHTLLSDGFFMDKGLMGELAKEKITKIMKYFNKDRLDIDISEIQIKLIIENIGEELLKNKLEKMYNNFYKIETKEDIYLRRIAELEEKIRASE